MFGFFESRSNSNPMAEARTYIDNVTDTLQIINTGGTTVERNRLNLFLGTLTKEEEKIWKQALHVYDVWTCEKYLLGTDNRVTQLRHLKRLYDTYINNLDNPAKLQR